MSLTELRPRSRSARKMGKGTSRLIWVTYLGSAFKERNRAGTMNINANYGPVLFETGLRVARRADQICCCPQCEPSWTGSGCAERWLLWGSRFWLFVLIVCLIALTGCTPWSPQNEIERADDLGLITSQPPPPPLLISSISDDYTENDRNRFVEEWMARSDYLCRQYKDKIIRFSRNTRFATDAVSTILSGLATIFTAVGTIHPLTGSATIVSGVGAAAQTDTFAQQSGEVVASAIQTARENQANQIEFSLTFPKEKYNIYRAQRDVIEYHNMCSMETALAQIRASLKATSPDAGKTPPAAQGTQTPGGAAPAVAPTGPPPGLRPPAAAITGPILLTPPVAEPVKPSEPVRPRIPRVPPVAANYRPFLEDASVQYTPSQVRKIFAALCVLPTEANDAGAESTRARIKAFQQWWHFDPAKPMPSATGRLTLREIDFLLGQPDCQRARFENIYEVNFRSGAGSGPPKDINSPRLIDAMNQKLAEPKLTPNATVEDMRSRIPEVRNSVQSQLVLTDRALSNQLTKDLVNILLGG